MTPHYSEAAEADKKNRKTKCVRVKLLNLALLRRVRPEGKVSRDGLPTVSEASRLTLCRCDAAREQAGTACLQ